MNSGNRSVSNLRAIGAATARAARQKVTPRTLARVPIDQLATSMERLRLQGGKDQAVQIGRTAVRHLPGSGKAHRYLVRSLLTEPVEPGDLVEARVVAEAMVCLWDDPAVSDQYMSVLIAQHAAGIDEPHLIDSTTLFFRAVPQRRLAPLRRLFNYLIDSNDIERVLQLCDDIGSDLPGADAASLIHEILLRCDEPDRAAALESLIQDETWALGELVPILAAARLTSVGDRTEALDLLRAQKPHRTRRYSTAYCDRLGSLGLHSEILEYLDNNVHNLASTKEMAYRFDALWLVGRTDEAEHALAEQVEDHFLKLDVIRRLLISFGSPDEVVRQHADELQQIRNPKQRTAADLENLAAVWFELNLIDDVLAIEAIPRAAAHLGTIGKYNLARAHYVRRDFERANTYFDQLSQSIRHWEAAKFQSRMLLEEGRFVEALAHREEFPRIGDPLDEVRFFSLLHLKRFAEAFSDYLSTTDRRRLEHVFDQHAEFDTFDAVTDRFVIAQNGPGDDIQTFAALNELSTRTDHLTATCDPRLHSLLSRSLPDVTFLPVERLGGRVQAGLLHPDKPERATGLFYDVLTAEAAKVAHDATRVVFSRSIPQLTVEPGSSRPSAPYLRPLNTLVEALAPRFTDLTKPTGLVWRSEIAGPMRDIHYLTVEAMRPFAEMDRDFVCLQHDTTDRERRQLERYFGDRITFLDDIDLRDDFESTAAVMANCDAVVGVVTTSVELAAAVGTPTILLQPNQFGAWRSQENGQDYWHAAARNACSENHQDPTECVGWAIAMLDSED